jgi:hypothetical protein
VAARDPGLGSPGTPLGDYGDARRGTDGRVGSLHLFAPIHGRGPVAEVHDTRGRGQEGRRNEEAEDHQARGRRQEGRRHQEAPDRPGPQGGRPEADHGPEVDGADVDDPEVHGPEVHDTRGRGQEGRRNEEAEDHEARGRRQEGRRHQEAPDRPGPQGGRPEADHGPEVDGADVPDPEVHGPEVHEARGRGQEGRGYEEAEDRPGPEGPGAERPLTDVDREGADPVGDSPGEPFEIPDEPVASDRPGTTAEEHRERSLDRRLAMDEPDVSISGRSADERTSVRPVLDDDVATEDAVAEDPDLSPEDAELDRTSEEIGEQSFERAESAEESAMHIERE